MIDVANPHSSPQMTVLGRIKSHEAVIGRALVKKRIQFGGALRAGKLQGQSIELSSALEQRPQLFAASIRA